MKKFEVKRNPKPLTDEQINRHMNFDKLLVDHSKLLKYKDATKPLYKDKKFMGFILLIGIVLLVFTLDSMENNATDKTKNNSLDSTKIERRDSIQMKD